MEACASIASHMMASVDGVPCPHATCFQPCDWHTFPDLVGRTIQLLPTTSAPSEEAILWIDTDYPYKARNGMCKDDQHGGFAAPDIAINGHVDLPTNNYTALIAALNTVGPIAISVSAGGRGDPDVFLAQSSEPLSHDACQAGTVACWRAVACAIHGDRTP